MNRQNRIDIGDVFLSVVLGVRASAVITIPARLTGSSSSLTWEASVTAGEEGPVISLSGEADLTMVTRLSAVLSGQLPAVTVELTIDVSGLRFVDSASIRALVKAARTLRDRGGRLALLHP